MSDAARDYPRPVQSIGLFVKGLVRFGWIPLIAVLLIAGLLGWATWKGLLAIGIAAALVIVLSPALFGVFIAIYSRRLHRQRETLDRFDE